jgi:hypothetical protein
VIDLEAAMSDILRADPDVVSRISDRTWLNMPQNPTFPALLLRRMGGAPSVAFQGLVCYDAAEIDIFAYGGSRVEALGLGHAALRALCAATGQLTVRPFSILRLPDPTVPQQNGRDRERYIVSVRAWGHEPYSHSARSGVR